MHVPLRLLLLLRPSVSPGILLAVGFNTVVLGATPFLLDLVAEHYAQPLAFASLISVAQLGGFVIGSWGSGRWLRPRRRVFVAALAVAVATNLVSALLPGFAVLVALRFASGLSLGLITWFAWVQVFGEEKGMGDIAVMGPIAGIISAPLVAVFAVGGGPASVFALLGALAIVPLLFNRTSGASHRVVRRSGRSRPVPAAAVILAALGVFSVGGSAVFQYSVVLGSDRAGLALETIALMFSANALASIPGAKWPLRRGRPGVWMAVTACCAIVMATAWNGVQFGGSMMVWGFAYWMAIPGVFSVLAERSAHPADRAGDAQAIMAGGRVVGPFVGGVVLDVLGPTALGLAGGGMMAAAGAAVIVAARIPRRQASVRSISSGFALIRSMR